MEFNFIGVKETAYISKHSFDSKTLLFDYLDLNFIYILLFVLVNNGRKEVVTKVATSLLYPHNRVPKQTS